MEGILFLSNLLTQSVSTTAADKFRLANFLDYLSDSLGQSLLASSTALWTLVILKEEQQ